MSWAAIVSGKARHSAPNAPTPHVTSSSTTTVTINPHIPILSHSTSNSTQSPSASSSSSSTSTHSHQKPNYPTLSTPQQAPQNGTIPSHSTSSSAPAPNPTSITTPSPTPTPPSSTPASSTASASAQPPHPPHPTPNPTQQPNQNHHPHRNRSQTKQKNHKRQQQQQQQQQQQVPQSHQSPAPQTPHPNTSPHANQSPSKQTHPSYNQPMWNDPRIVAIYRLWAHHISTFMAQPVPFFHIFVVNPQFRQSVFDAGLTFHPDTDRTNPVLINLNSGRFGMAERISALSPPARFDTNPAPNPNSSTPQTPMSPLSEPSQPSHPPQLPQQLQQPPSPAFLAPSLTNIYESLKSPSNPFPNPDQLSHYDAFNNSLYSFEPFDPLISPDPSLVLDESVAQRFVEATRLDVSDSESERLSEGDPNSVNGVKSQTSVTYDKPRHSPTPVRRRNGRSRVVSRVMDIRIPSSPACKKQSDKAKVEFIEQIGEIFPRITPPKESTETRADLLARLRKIISDEWEGAGIDVYGSAGNGLALRSADLDMSLHMPHEVAKASGREQGVPDSPKIILARLAEIMKENDMVILTKILNARVPVIKMQDPVSKLQVDVCVNNTLAVRNTELLKAYVDLDERFRYVCILVKRWAKKRDLNDSYHGTLSSYAYTLLVIHYLQAIQPPVLPCLQRMVNGELVDDDEDLPTEMTDNGAEKLYNTYFDRTVTPETFTSENTQPVHELVMGFFKYYAFTFKYRTDLASIRLGVKTPRSARGWDESAVYAEWEAKQAQYKTQLEAARVALDARRKADSEEWNSKAKGLDSSDATGTENPAKKERIQFPQRPRLASKHLFCIEDPFDIDHDLSRGMEKAAVTVIRQEMIRAYELIAETGDYEAVCEEYG